MKNDSPGRSWAALGRSWVALGRSWGALGALLGALGPLLGGLGAVLERHAKFNQKSMPKTTNFGSKNVPKRHPKTTKKRTKKQHEKRTQKRSKKEPQHDKKTCPAVNGKRRLKTLFVFFKRLVCMFSFHVLKKISASKTCHRPTQQTNILRTLCRSWATFGRSWAAFCCSWPLLGRSWPLLGRSWPPRCRPKTLQRRIHTASHTQRAHGHACSEFMPKSMLKMTDLDTQKPSKSTPK